MAKKASKYKKMPLGTGQRFAQFVKDLMSRGYSKERATKIAAAHGWKRYGKKMGKMAAAARRKK